MVDVLGPRPGAQVYYRRLVFHWYDPASGAVSLDGFRPNKNDTDGLSLSHSITPAEVAATGESDKQYWVAEFAASSLVAGGMTAYLDAADHAYIPQLSRASYDRDKDQSAVLGEHLRRSVLKVHGPFPGAKPPRARASPKQ
jgi:hypothetical protein